MSSFLYFFPDLQGFIDFERLGLGHAGTGVTTREANTPHGRGILAMSGGQSSDAKYEDDKQTWRKIPEKFCKVPAWCGYWNDRPPTVDDLARKNQLPGELVTLADGKQWLVPVLRKYRQDDSPGLVYDISLPTMLDYSDDGDLTLGEVAPQYRQVWEMGLKVGQSLAWGDEGDEASVDFGQVVEFAGPLLGLNYRVSMFELVFLKLVGVKEAEQIVHVALDLKGMEERLKNLLGRLDSSGTTSQSGV